MPVAGAGGLGTEAVGFPFILVQVESLSQDSNMASCVDSFGKYRDIRTDIRRGGGRFPREKEVWLIDRTLGTWSFSAVVQSVVPEVTGSISDGTALTSLLETLEAMGLIINKTT